MTVRRLRELLGAIVSLTGLIVLFLAPADSSAAPGDLEVVAATGQKDFGEVGNPDITPAISADGRSIAYVEKSFEGDPLMLRDLRQATSTEVVPAMGIYHDVVHPSISAHGRYLAFASNIRSLLGKGAEEGRRAGRPLSSSMTAKPDDSGSPRAAVVATVRFALSRIASLSASPFTNICS